MASGTFLRHNFPGKDNGTWNRDFPMFGKLSCSTVRRLEDHFCHLFRSTIGQGLAAISKKEKRLTWTFPPSELALSMCVESLQGL